MTLADRAAVAALTRLIRRESCSLVARVRDWTTARWASGTSTGTSRGDVGHHLATRLAVAAQGLEQHAEAAPPLWRVLPRLDTDLVVPDQIAVTAADLLAALTTAEDSWSPTGQRVSKIELAAGCLAELQLHRYDLDGSPPLQDAVDAVMRLLDPSGTHTPARLVLVARERCRLTDLGVGPA